jgi:hypothetical protein
MTLLQPKLDPRELTDREAEALIREARRLRRQRWMFASVVVVLVVAGTAVGLVANSGTARPTRLTTLTFRADGPTVNAKAFAGEGELAFVSRDTLFVLDGATGALQRVALPSKVQPDGARPARGVARFGAPSFSHDGRWLAIPATKSVVSANGDESEVSTLWLADADGSNLHEVMGFNDPNFLGWSPTADLLAVTNQAAPTSLWLVSPSGGRRELVRAGSGLIDGATWSSNGSEVAVGELSAYPFQDHVPWVETLTVYPIDGAKPTVWLRIVNPISNGCCDTADLKQSQFIPVGWWPHWGIVFWDASADIGSGLAGGSFPLFSLPAPGDKPIPLGSTAAGGQVSTIVTSASGELAISDNREYAGIRPFWQNEQVLRCDPTILSCAPVASPPGTVSFDPVWSPDGKQLAYLVGKEGSGEGNAGFAQKSVASWYDSLQLWLYSPRTGRSVEVSAAKGAVVPIWSADSKSLLYIDNDGLWLLKTPNSQPVEIVGPLLPPDDWGSYYAQVHWAGTFAWSQSQNVPQPGVLTPM